MEKKNIIILNLPNVFLVLLSSSSSSSSSVLNGINLHSFLVDLMGGRESDVNCYVVLLFCMLFYYLSSSICLFICLCLDAVCFLSARRC